MGKSINTNESVDKLRMYFKKNKSNSYPIKGHPLEEGDEYEKGLYITMLCAIMFNDSEAREEQRLFIERLITGIELSGNINDYIKKALELDDKFAENYVRQFKDNDLKYNFVVDSLILISSVGSPVKKNVEFISEICDILVIEKKELSELVKLTGIILEQNSDKYKEFCSLELSIDISRFFFYALEFTQGILSNNSKLFYVKFENRSSLINEKIFTILESISSKKVILENILFDGFEKLPQFDNCDDILINKCVFKDNKMSLQCTQSQNVVIKNCKFKRLKRRALYLTGFKNVGIVECDFEECSIDEDDNRYPIYGGAIYIGEGNSFKIDACNFTKCETNHSEGGNANGAVAYLFEINKFELENCQFNYCKNEVYRYGWSECGSLFEIKDTECEAAVNCKKNNCVDVGDWRIGNF